MSNSKLEKLKKELVDRYRISRGDMLYVYSENQNDNPRLFPVFEIEDYDLKYIKILEEFIMTQIVFALNEGNIMTIRLKTSSAAFSKSRRLSSFEGKSYSAMIYKSDQVPNKSRTRNSKSKKFFVNNEYSLNYYIEDQ